MQQRRGDGAKEDEEGGTKKDPPVNAMKFKTGAVLNQYTDKMREEISENMKT